MLYHLFKDQALIAYLHPQDNSTNQKQASMTSHYELTNQPSGKFVLLPCPDGTLLIKSLAVQELMLPCHAGNHAEEPCDQSLNFIAESLDKVWRPVIGDNIQNMKLNF